MTADSIIPPPPDTRQSPRRLVSQYRRHNALTPDFSRRDAARILRGIKDGDWRAQANLVRSAETDAFYRAAKDMAECYTPAGAWPEGKRRENAFEPNGIVFLELDYKDQGEAALVLHKHPSVLASYVSIGGKGRHYWFLVNGINDWDDYRRGWELARSAMGLADQADESVKNANRLAYLSYDPEAYINPVAVALTLPAAKSADTDPQGGQPAYGEAKSGPFSGQGGTRRPVGREIYLSALLSIATPDDYKEWLALMMAAKASGLTWDDGVAQWCARGGKADPVKDKATWDSIKPEGGITPGTLIEKAKKCGWQWPATGTPGGADGRPSFDDELARFCRHTPLIVSEGELLFCHEGFWNRIDTARGEPYGKLANAIDRARRHDPEYEAHAAFYANAGQNPSYHRRLIRLLAKVEADPSVWGIPQVAASELDRRDKYPYQMLDAPAMLPPEGEWPADWQYPTDLPLRLVWSYNAPPGSERTIINPWWYLLDHGHGGCQYRPDLLEQARQSAGRWHDKAAADWSAVQVAWWFYREQIGWSVIRRLAWSLRETHKKIDVLTGPKDAGKSTLFRAVTAAMPGVVIKIQPAGEFSGKGGGFTPVAAEMEDRFLVWVDEADKADFSKPGATHIYADDELQVHLKHQNARMGRRNANVWLVGNDKPAIDVSKEGGTTRYAWVGQVALGPMSGDEGAVVRRKLLEPDALAILSTLVLEAGVDDDPADTEATRQAAADWQDEWADQEVAILRDEFEPDPTGFIPTADLTGCVKEALDEVSKGKYFADKIRKAFSGLTAPELRRVDGKRLWGWRLRRKAQDEATAH